MNGLLHLTWNTHGISLTQSIDNLRSKGIFCDVTIACKGKFFPLHRFLLSTCSEYFDEILTMTPCHHPFIIVKDIEVEDLEALLDFIYRGKVDIPQHQVMSVVKAAEALKIKGFGVSKDSPDQLNKKFSNKTEMANMEQDSSGKENENVMHSELEQEQITVSDEQTISAVDFQSNTIQDTSQTQEQSLCIKVKKIPYGKSLLISRKRKKHNLLRSSLQQKKRKKVGLDETEKLKLKIKKPIVNEESPNLANTFRLTPVCSNSALSSNNNSDKQTPCIQEVESEIFFKNLDDVFDDQDNDIVVEDTLLSLPGSYPIVESDLETNTGVGDDIFIVKTEPHSESSSTSSVGNSKNAKKGELLFYVVEVVEEKEKAVIPANWMIKDSSNKCHWPPMYADAFELASKYSSPEADWSVRDVKVIQSFGSFSEAKKFISTMPKTPVGRLPFPNAEVGAEKAPSVNANAKGGSEIASNGTDHVSSSNPAPPQTNSQQVESPSASNGINYSSFTELFQQELMETTENSFQSPSPTASSSQISLNLDELLNSSYKGRLVKSVYEQKNCLDNDSRKWLVEIIVTYLMNYSLKVPTCEFEKAAELIQAFFPNEYKETFFIPRTLGRRLVGGKLIENYKCQRRKLLLSGFLTPRKQSLEKVAVVEEQATSQLSVSTENLECVEMRTEALPVENDRVTCDSYSWLKEHVSPWESVMAAWEETREKRMAFVNSSQYLQDVFNEWPILKQPQGYTLLEADFKSLYPERENALMTSWDKICRALYLKCVESVKNPSVQKMLNFDYDNVSEDGRNAVVLSLLPNLCRPTFIHKVPGKKVWKINVLESKEGFILHVKEAKDIKLYIESKRKMKEEKGLTLQPFVIVVGKTLAEIESSHVYIDGVLYSLPSVLKAVDVCFKAFHVLHASYPIESAQVWMFLQLTAYGMSTMWDKYSPNVHSLISELKLQ